jgi:molybdenum cofactor synthesis domain-containing protein
MHNKPAAETQANQAIITAAVLIIGDEILSGRTQDKNLGWLAEYLGRLGIQILEARVVTDEQDAIIEAVHALRTRYTYVFTTGGIGPTPDDMTAEAIAAAFDIEYGFHPEARRILLEFYGDQATDARMRMAKMPVTAKLIHNPVSHAPGFYVENVFVMAGVPKIMQAMMMSLDGVLTPGRVRHSLSFTIQLPESKVAGAMTAAMAQWPGVAVGSYPKMLDGGGYETSLVLRGYDTAELESVRDWFQAEIKKII